MNEELAQKAIKAAIGASWREAVKINKQILNSSPEDVDALNRLARANAEIGHIAEAKRLAQKVLKIDTANSIATKSLEKWKTIKKAACPKAKVLSAEVFLEEAGKTKIVPLIFPGSPTVLAQLDSGDEVNIDAHSHRVSIIDDNGKYIGRLPDDLASRLRKLIKLGNKYQAFIKSVNKSEISVFIKEIERGATVGEIPSFSSEKINYISFTPPELVRKKDEMPESETED